jgi:hypothetical protein
MVSIETAESGGWIDLGGRAGLTPPGGAVWIVGFNLDDGFPNPLVAGGGLGDGIYFVIDAGTGLITRQGTLNDDSPVSVSELQALETEDAPVHTPTPHVIKAATGSP